ncbi:trypsin-1-like, partial [Anoplophora glabripennis]|uniref:trypsin-1-like n=1 Tax=Anoplophora glabripennis TaxID=217634 RepID=UPI000874EF10
NAFVAVADVRCGSRKVARRFAKVVGGENAEKGEFPWLVSITRRGGHFCGGTVINNRFVLTAGHCLCSGVGQDILKPANIKITLSQHDLTNTNSDAYQMDIKTVMIHPGYICNKPKDDIAMLELEKELQWSDSVIPACLPVAANHDRYSKFDNILATVAGWGWTNEKNSKGGRAKILQKAKVNVIETEKCRSWYKAQGKKTKIQETQLCAGHEQGGIDACWADSGGPLMINTEGQNDQMVVVGVVSTGIGCARPQLPGIYTRVSEYIPWITETIRR